MIHTKKVAIILIILILIFNITGCNNTPSEIIDIPNENTDIVDSTQEVVVRATPIPKISLPISVPENHGFSVEALGGIHKFITDEVGAGFPGAVLLIAHKGEIVFHESYGFALKYEGKEPLDNPISMTDDTLFDLASLTKIYATTFSIMKLVDQGKIDLDDTVSKYLAGFGNGEKSQITIRMLLSHKAGFDSSFGFYLPDSGDLYSLDRDNTISLLSEMELVSSPNTEYKYSDLGFMILGAVIESVSGQRLDEFVKSEIFDLLFLDGQAMFMPLDNGIAAKNIAATERMGNTRDGAFSFPTVREYTLQGEVHDEKAYYSMGAVSGHAGLFADAKALAVLNQLIIDGGSYGGIEIFSQDTVNKFTAITSDSKYQLGFWQAKAQSGIKDNVSDTTFYNNGWTGVASVIDLENQLSIILLTNKRHSSCEMDVFQGSTDYDTGNYSTIINMVYEAYSP